MDNRIQYFKDKTQPTAAEAGYQKKALLRARLGFFQ